MSNNLSFDDKDIKKGVDKLKKKLSSPNPVEVFWVKLDKFIGGK